MFQLQWRGKICPCLEKSEDAAAREALAFLSGTEVKWLRKGRDKGVGGLVSSWFQSAKKGTIPTADVVDSKLQWIDKDYGDGGPELQIKPKPMQQTINESTGEISLQKQSSGYIKTIKLKDLDNVVLQDETLVVLQTDNSSGGSSSPSMKDLASMHVSTDKAVRVKEAFTLMLEWDGRRRAEIPQEEREIDEKQGIQARAQKAAHFAKREIELQQMRRDREKRKANLVKDVGGGLKYTALAMASRAAAENMLS